MSNKVYHKIEKYLLQQKTSVGYMKSFSLAVLNLFPKAIQKEILRSKRIRSTYKSFGKRYRHLKGVLIPYKSPRVFVRIGISRMEFFSELNKRNTEYVLLRWWHDLPEIPEGEDMDILIKDEHRHLIKDLLTYTDNGTGLKCDFYTITGSNYGSHKGIPYFQSTLARDLLKTREIYRGAYVPSPKLYFASLAYHAIFHKGANSGLKGFDIEPKDKEHDYSLVLKQQMQPLGLNLEMNVNAIYSWLVDNNYAPAEDTLAKLVEIKPELNFLQKNLFSDIRGGELLVYVIREQLLQDNLLNKFADFLAEKYHFDVIDKYILSSSEKEKCSNHIRGGKWDKGPFKYSGGNPAAFVVAFDYYPEPLTSSELKKQSRMTNRNNLRAKYEFRDLVNSDFKIKQSHYNGVHSADNEHDAEFYISLLGEDYANKIDAEVELRRERIERKWDLVQVLSQGPVSKTEVIRYKGALAIKKTFRIGKERCFRRELYAARELSKSLDFIPPLLKEGNGYIIRPYYENKLENMSLAEKKEVLAKRKNKIIGMIKSFYEEGITLINFSVENLVFTPEGKIYCIGLSYLQAYDKIPNTLEEAYEINEIPKDFDGDLPDGYENKNFSYKNKWEPYLGVWDEELKEV